MLQAVSTASKKRFKITEQGDPVEFLSWLLNTLHLALGGSKKAHSSLIYDTFQGTMTVYSRKLPPPSDNEAETKALMEKEEYKETHKSTSFLYLTLDLPPPPLFQDELEQNIIPQVALFDLLSKFDGTTEKEHKTASESFVKRYKLTRLPPYLILCIKRFTKNYFYLEKNPTIVNFPVKDIDMDEFLPDDPDIQRAHPHTKYDLIANICHDGAAGPGKGTFRVHVKHKGASQWFELQDLHVTELQAQMITLAESYIQIYQLQVDDGAQME